MSAAPSNDKIAAAVVALLMLLVLTVFAGFNDKLGKVIMTLIGGFGVYWLFAGPGSQVVSKAASLLGTSSNPGSGTTPASSPSSSQPASKPVTL